MSENINVGKFSEALNNKQDRNQRNTDTGSGADAVVEFQNPTTENGYTWYRKYASGRVEQGGICNSYNYQTISLPVEMRDKDYTVQLTERVINRTTTTGETANSQVIYDNCSTTSLYVYINNSANTGAYWEVKGMAASL